MKVGGAVREREKGKLEKHEEEEIKERCPLVHLHCNDRWNLTLSLNITNSNPVL